MARLPSFDAFVLRIDCLVSALVYYGSPQASESASSLLATTFEFATCTAQPVHSSYRSEACQPRCPQRPYRQADNSALQITGFHRTAYAALAALNDMKGIQQFKRFLPRSMRPPRNVPDDSFGSSLDWEDHIRDDVQTLALLVRAFTLSRCHAHLNYIPRPSGRTVIQSRALYPDLPILSDLLFGVEKWTVEDNIIAMQYFLRKTNEYATANLDLLPLLVALPYFSERAFEIDWLAFETCELFTALPDCLFKVPMGSQWKMIPPGDSEDYEEAQWTRVPAPPIPGDTLMKPRLKRPVTAADIPRDLHNLIAHYFVHEHCMHHDRKNRGHECRDEQECERNYVRCSQDELRSVALVCCRWARTVQPAIFVFVDLNNRKVVQLETLLQNSTTLIRQYVAHIGGKLDGAEHLRKPSVHHLGLFVIPKLSELKNSTVSLNLKGPLPKKHEMLSSIHPFPSVHACFSAGIRNLRLKKVHFKTFTHLVRLIREMPSVRSVWCNQVTWGTREGEVVYPTSFLARDDPSEPVEYYFMEDDYTDDAGGAWLGILLGQTRADVLDQIDAGLLCAIAKAEGCYHSRREQDRIMFQYLGFSVDSHIYTYLTPRAPNGVRTRRRIRAFAFIVGRKNFDWLKIDEALATLNSLGALQVVFFVLDGGDEREEYLKDIAPSMPFLTRSPMLKFALKSQNSEHNHLCTQAVLKDVGRINVLTISQVKLSKERMDGRHFYREASYAYSMLLSSASSINVEGMLADLTRKAAPLAQDSTAWPPPLLDFRFCFWYNHPF
ncbi:hypothetical protein NM688_g751 [Phlebia brevispora]|uniref:Uncharacterized protein n=1 Tax=Phlebia brevispora TaxID=194682 RepID=A0ACC1TE78_9APHY|nr:hypothetical protein NM688_g751 [Phlebia brevispora]